MSNRLKPFSELRGEQRIASDPRELVWLSASAGTGKTHVLSARVLRLLLSGVRPETVLCLTFTKAGAAEMAERVHARLAWWVRLDDNALKKELFALGAVHDADAIARARALFAAVLDAPGGGLRIQTIHAFCQTLLAGFPDEAGLAPGFRPLEGREEAALARRTLGELLDRAERGGDFGLIGDVQALSRRLGEKEAESYLMACARAPQAMKALGPGIAAKVRTALDVPLGDVGEAIERACVDAAFDVAAVLAVSRANAAWGTATGLKAADTCAAFLAAAPASRAAMLDDLAGVVLTKTGEPRKASAKLVDAEPGYAMFAERVGAACNALIGLRLRAALADILARGLRAGQAYARAYADAKRIAGVVDFDDLIRATVRLLQTDGMGDWVRYKLDQAIDHILVDEAQDTNVAQWTIVAALAGEFFAGAGARHPAHRTIFTVGDFKQAIFGFQGTDPAAFLAASQVFDVRARGADREFLQLSLDRSFRSTPPVLELVDRLIEDLGHGAMGLDAPPPRHVSAREGRLGAVTIWPPVAVGSSDEADAEEGWIDDATRAFAGRLAKQVRAWMDDPFWVDGKGRPFRPEDLLILVRKRGELASLIVARLHAEGVPVAGVDRLRLTAPLAVRDLLAAVRFVLQPDDDLNLAGLLVSPLVGLSQDELYAVGFGRKGSLWQAVRAHGGVAAARDLLAGLLATADLTTPYRFLEALLSGPIDGRRKLLARLGQEARDPIEELLNAALQFESDSTPSLQRFIDWFDRGDVEIKRDPSAPLDAVRVMTVHGSKGLQAPVVVLADATGDPGASPVRGLDWTIEDGVAVPVFRPRKAELAGGGLADDLERARRRDLEEHWRLLYVATTRAEERLLIGGALGARDVARGGPAQDSWYRALRGAMDALGAVGEADPLWGEAHHHRGGAARGGKARPSRPDIPFAEPAWLRAPAPRESRPPKPLAPSSLGADTVADPPPTPAMLEAARRGTLLHALFERLPAIAPDRRAATALAWLEHSAGVADAAVREALAGDALAIIADPAFADLFGADALAEAPIAAVVGGDVVAGTVDRLLVSESRVRIVDFKTGRRVPAGRDAVPEHHLRQMAAYAAALEVIFPGRTVDVALLYTAGPSLIVLPPELLHRHKPGLTG
ncbi:DNA helicase/exodeoxyribonuclease V, subunit A [Sphingomonas laterariae]|uniref:DNA 3'-5' helicase n=1 Tax=Edaphosphingomonas laterariae TaxID=861865 RepID=A0A239JSY8_9SPHN|nr:double-strand break repair helicase AddA [Sphingomonas laterariae]SNT08548.1 DNA helicase/exodeoxyribonuclease V, subunit A [Sphingomonas laterariae]